MPIYVHFGDFGGFDPQMESEKMSTGHFVKGRGYK